MKSFEILHKHIQIVLLFILDDAEDSFSVDPVLLHDQIKYNMRNSLDLEDDGCYLQPGKKESIEECGFNTTFKTILIIHGWTVRFQMILWLALIFGSIFLKDFVTHNLWIFRRFFTFYLWFNAGGFPEIV